MVPETRYARLRDRQVAYQIVGNGPIDMLVVPPAYLPIDLMWEQPAVVRFLDRLSTFSRSIWFDSWGMGSSGQLPHDQARMIEAVVDDIVGLLDAIGWKRAAVLDVGGSLASPLFAATHPERTQAMVLHSPTARLRQAADYPEGFSDEDVQRRLAGITAMWGTGGLLKILAPSMADDTRFVQWWAHCERLACTPDEALWRFRGWYDSDLRDVLPSIKVPTLVLQRAGRTTSQAQYVAEHIASARFVEIPGEQLFFTGDTRPALEAMEEFLTGKLPTYDIDRVLATVVFTDIVGSTGRAAELGDQRWRELLASHDNLVRGELQRFRGQEIKSMGDGFLATFDGPGRAVRCSAAIRDGVRGMGVELRVGVHTGEIELQDDDVRGIAVHIAQRVMADAQPGEIIVSSTVRDLVAGSGIVFEDRGMHELRGVPDSWRLFAATV